MTAVGNARSMCVSIIDFMAKANRQLQPALASGGEIKRALVETGITRFLPAHSCAEHLLEHLLLEPADDGVLIEHVLQRRVALQNLRPLFIDFEFRHVAFGIADFAERFGPIYRRLAPNLLFEA